MLAVLGVADAEQLFGAVDAVVARDPAAALRAAAALADSRPRPRPGAARPRGPRAASCSPSRSWARCRRSSGSPPSATSGWPRRRRRWRETDAVRLLDLVAGGARGHRQRRPGRGSSSSSCWSRPPRRRSTRRRPRCWRGSSGSRPARATAPASPPLAARPTPGAGARAAPRRPRAGARAGAGPPRRTLPSPDAGQRARRSPTPRRRRSWTRSPPAGRPSSSIVRGENAMLAALLEARGRWRSTSAS